MTATIWQPHDSAAAGRVVEFPLGVRDLTAQASSAAGLTWEVAALGPGVAEVRVTPDAPAAVRVAWRVPCVDVTAFWVPDSGEHRGLPPFWRRPRRTSLEKGAPVGALIGAGDVSLCTYALAEVVRPVLIRTGVVEETGDFGFWAEHEAAPDAGLVLRLDFGGGHFARALDAVVSWWGAHEHPQAPRAARVPAYSTWYAMQQHVTAESVERQAAAAAALGCEAIIVDDGWHSDDRGRGYGYVGEWRPSPAFPDMAAHVAKVKAHGLAYLLWYALPFAGRHTALWDRVQDYSLARKPHMNAVVLDPRYPHIRALITGNLARAVDDWGADGLKIDFIDQFAVENPPEPGPEADCATVNEGVRRLMAELAARLPAGAPIELRQPYTSPGLWRHASMIRASDCPLSALHNRQRTIDLRLIAGPLAVHADMLMWHPAESAEHVAVQLINVLFAVPQISVDLTAQSAAQTAALRFWLGFVKEHAEVLQRGVLTPSRPDLHYPLVTAEGAGVTVAARYAPVPVEIPAGGTLLLANADDSTAVLLRSPLAGTAAATVYDCRGEVVSRGAHAFEAAGTHQITVPTGGLLKLVTPG
ncbi:glycoside hydrolase family 36 protein [Nonomuraea typhae]|uniref:glycoside hydrolase family 36 protein n=1 Tax=Nonomuraea typhae TaxID=2603600 RepID=UPI001FE7286F|nr:glycoside hydrolase family 36 protein [Nonomuraea typhae]